MRKTLTGTLAALCILAATYTARAAWVEQLFYLAANTSTVQGLVSQTGLFPNSPYDPGGALLNYWITLDPIPPFPFVPNFAVTSLEGITGAGNNYGSQIQGYFQAPEDGPFTFYIASSQNSQFWLSTDHTMANKQLVCRLGNAGTVRSVGPRNYGVFPGIQSGSQFVAEQRSAPVTLQGGKWYYFQIIQATTSSGDHVSVGMQHPDGHLERPIPTKYLQRFTPAGPDFFGNYDWATAVSGAAPTIPSYSGSAALGTLYATEKTDATLWVNVNGTQPMTYTWYRNGTKIANNMSFLDVTNANLASGSATYRVGVTNAIGGTEVTINFVVQQDFTPPTIVSAATLGSPQGFVMQFSEPLGNGATNANNYKLNVGVNVTNAQFQFGTNRSVIVLSTDAVLVNPGPQGVVVTVNSSNITDIASTPNQIGTTPNPNTGRPANQSLVGLVGGLVERRFFNNIGGTSIQDLYRATNQWPNNPNLADFASSLQVPVNAADNYGVELRGVIVPPETGTYTFFVSADDQAVVYLGTSDDPATKKIITYEPEWNGSRNYAVTDRRLRNGFTINYPNPANLGQTLNITTPNRVNGSLVCNRSDNINHEFDGAGTGGSITLTAGRRYYIEAAMKEGGGGDNLEIAWLLPSQGGGNVLTASPNNGSAPIPGQFLDFASIGGVSGPVQVASQTGDQTVQERFAATFSVNAGGSPILTYQWYELGGADGVKIVPDATSATLSFRVSALDNGRTFFCVINNSFSKTTSTNVVLTVVPDNTAPTVYRAVGSPDFNSVTVSFSEPVDVASATTRANYAIRPTAGGATSQPATLAVQRETNVVLGFAHTTGVNYTVTVNNVKDQAVVGNTITNSPTVTFTGFILSRGFLVAEDYGNIGGTAVSDLINNSKYINKQPDRVRTLTRYESHYNADYWGTGNAGELIGFVNNYGVKIYGFIIPPVSGDYGLAVASDDGSELWISTDATVANRKLVAREPQWNGHRNWNGTDRRPNRENQGTLVAAGFPSGGFTAGNTYYTEYFFKEGGGGDNGAVTWRLPGEANYPANNSEPRISGLSIASYQNPDGTAINFTTQPPAATNRQENQTLTLTIAFTAAILDNATNVPNARQWQSSPDGTTWTDIAGANGTSYTTPLLTPSDNNKRFRALVFIPGRQATSTVSQLSVGLDTVRPTLTQIRGTEFNDRIFVQFSENVTTASANVATNYTVTGLTVNAATLQSDGRTVRLDTTPQTPGTQYSVSIKNVQDRAATPNTLDPNPTATTVRAWDRFPGYVIREYYDGIGGTSVSDLTNNAAFQANNPSQMSYNNTWDSSDRADNYGLKMYGWFVPPVTGNYVIWVSSDDQGLVSLSTDDNPANKRPICVEPQWNGYRSWNTTDRRVGQTYAQYWFQSNPAYKNDLPANRSDNCVGLLRLTNGQPYYLELLMKEGGGGDPASLGITMPGGEGLPFGISTNLPDGTAGIAGAYSLTWSTADNVINFTTQPGNTTVVDGSAATLNVGTSTTVLGQVDTGNGGTRTVRQWQSSTDGTTWVDVAGQTGTSLTTPALFINQSGIRYRCRVRIPGQEAFSASATVTVIPPSLKITKAGTNALVSWPASAPGYTLQGVGFLPALSNDWQTVGTNNQGVVGAENVNTNPANVGNKIFRLTK